MVWAWATHFNLNRKILRVPCGYFEHQRRVQFEGCVAEPLQTITATLPGSKWSWLLQRIVLQDALSEVAQIYPPLKLKVFVDDITAFCEWEEQGVGGDGRESSGKVEEVQEKGYKLSITEGGKEGKSKVIITCRYLEEMFQECSKKGVVMASSVETRRVDL